MLGFRPSEEEIKGVFHLWKYIGHLLGIEHTLLPESEEQAIESLYKWTMTQPPADSDTIALAQALVYAPLTATYPEKHWQKKLLVGIYLGFNYYYLGKHACKRMNLPKTGFKFFSYVLALINRINECGIWASADMRQRAINKGRKAQIKITEAFLKSTGFVHTTYKTHSHD